MRQDAQPKGLSRYFAIGVQEQHSGSFSRVASLLYAGPHIARKLLIYKILHIPNRNERPGQLDCTSATVRTPPSVPCEMVRRLLTVAAMLAALAPAASAAQASDATLDRELRHRAGAPRGYSRVILRLNPGVSAGVADAGIRGLRGIVGRRLTSVSGQVADVPR